MAHMHFVVSAEMNWSLATPERGMLWASRFVIFSDLILLAFEKIKAE